LGFPVVLAELNKAPLAILKNKPMQRKTLPSSRLYSSKVAEAGNILAVT